MARNELTAKQVGDSIQDAVGRIGRNNAFAWLADLQGGKAAALQRESNRSCLPTERIVEGINYYQQLMPVLNDYLKWTTVLSAPAIPSDQWSIHGRILDADGNPVAGVSVNVRRYNINENPLATVLKTPSNGYFMVSLGFPVNFSQADMFYLQVTSPKTAINDTCYYYYRIGMLDYREFVVPLGTF